MDFSKNNSIDPATIALVLVPILLLQVGLMFYAPSPRNLSFDRAAQLGRERAL